jgi:hypothetical protein
MEKLIMPTELLPCHAVKLWGICPEMSLMPYLKTFSKWEVGIVNLFASV